MIRIKSGVTFHEDSFRTYAIPYLIRIAIQTAPSGYDPTITSAGDGRHSVNSAHYTGKALDFRTRDLKKEEVPIWADRMRMALGNQYFVLVESDHIHVQYNGD